jgi:uncharacterized protein (DUF1015 family)
MIKIRPFKALRPKEELVHQVACLPYDVMNTKEAAKMAEGNPNSFLHVTRSEIDFENLESPYSEKVYLKAKENLNQMIGDGILIEDEKPMYYLYRQVMEGRVQTGIVGCASIDDYMEGKIKKHEYTRHEKELDRINHFDCCDAHTEPVFLTFRTNKALKQIIQKWTENHSPVYNFQSEDGIQHALWPVDEDQITEQIKALFEKMEAVYIADGHHRTASAVKIGLKRREKYPAFTGEEEFNYLLSVVFPQEDLYIMEYNRVVKDLNGHSLEAFIEEVKKKFTLEKKEAPVQPDEKHSFGMYLEKQWYKLKAKKETYDETDVISQLDVTILQNYLLQPILGIEDPRTDKRIDFIGGIRGVKELERRIESDMALAFSMYATTIEDLLSIADKGEVMPPKSTWFEPKLRSGLFVHLLKSEE